MIVMRSTWVLLGTLGSLAMLGCGSVDTLPFRPDGQGGASGATVGSTVGSTSATGGSGSCTVNAECPNGSWCAHLGCGGPGTCVPLPMGCPEDCPGVCGCDDVTYCNVCEAASMGIDVKTEEPCEGLVSYRAVAWYGGLDHLIVMKANVSDGICTRIHAAAPTTGPFSVVMPEAWAVSHVDVGGLTGDCLDENVPLQNGNEVEDLLGTISWQGAPTIPCEVTVDVVVDFGEFLVPETVQATIPVEGCQ